MGADRRVWRCGGRWVHRHSEGVGPLGGGGWPDVDVDGGWARGGGRTERDE